MNRKWHEVAEMSENGLKRAEMPYNDQNITEMVRKWPSKMVGNELKMVDNGRNLLKITENYGKWLTMPKR